MDNELREKFKQEITYLFKEAYLAKAQYVVLNNVFEEYLKGCKEYQYLIVTIFDALEFSILSKLTKIYDDDLDKQSITILHVFNKVQCCKLLNEDNNAIKEFVLKIIKEIEEKNVDISKIKNCRDKVVAHIDKKYPKGLLSMKPEEQLNFDLLREYSEYAYEKIKKLYELIYGNELFDTKQFEILEKEYESISNRLKIEI